MRDWIARGSEHASTHQPPVAIFLPATNIRTVSATLFDRGKITVLMLISSIMGYCSRCDRDFLDDHAFEQHRRNSARHHVCEECDEDFRTAQKLINHWIRSSVHPYCQICDRHFRDDYGLEAHRERAHWYCSDCERVGLC